MSDLLFIEEPVNYRIGGRRLRQWRVTAANPGETIPGIDFAANLRQWLEENPNSDLRVAIRLPELGWRSAPRWFHAGDDVQLVADESAYDLIGDDEDGVFEDGNYLDSIEEALVIARPHVVPAGGCRTGDKSRDCFWRCLSRAMTGNLPVKISNDKALRLMVGAPPPGQLFPATQSILSKVENLLPPDMALVVTGDSSYSSSKKKTRIVHLHLRSEHFELRCPDGRSQTYSVSTAAQNKPLVAAEFFEDGKVKLHGKEGLIKTLSLDAALALLRKPHSSPYVIIKAPPGAAAKALADWEAARQVLLGSCKLDLIRYSRYKDFALELFRLMSLTIPAAAPMDGAEEEWVAGAMRGGLIFGENFDGHAVGIDVRSAYPAAMVSKLVLPIGAGSFETLAALPEHPSVGIYRVKIVVPQAKQKLWRSAGAGFGYYTHLDINAAKLLGGTVELAQDGGANACIYTAEAGRIPAYQIFGEYVKKLYAAKDAAASNPNAAARAAPKRILNILWGALCERTKEKLVVRPGAEADIPDEIVSFSRYKDGGMCFKVRPKGASMFSGAYPRFGPFIMAKVRLDMATMLLPHIAAVKRIHTDGAVLAGALPSALAKKVSAEIGALKIEHTGTAHVKNAMKVTWE